MLHVRLIPTLTLKDGRIIKTLQFDRYRDVGHPVTSGKVYDSQDVDELIFLDIISTQEGREPNWKIISAFAEECSMPLTIGGGVAALEHIRKLLQIGADKVSINSAAARRPDFIREAADMFGGQCIVVSIDAKKRESGDYEVLIDGGYEATGLDPVSWAQQAEEMGAGEILLTSIDREGTMMGYDVELIDAVVAAVGIPVIANGGAGILYDLVEAVQTGGASAAACASIFHFTDNKPIKARAFMRQHGVHVRPV